MAARPTLRRGDRGGEVVTLQTCLGLIADGIFGPITETEVKQFQAQHQLVPDGIVGPLTWAVLETEFDLPPYKPPPPPAGGLSADEIARITTLARNSAIQRYNWRGRGIMPPGCCKGLAVAYGYAVRKFHAGHSAFREMAKANTGNSDKDVMAWESGRFNAVGMSNEKTGIDTLRHLYAYMYSLCMRESSGRHCEGKDASASNVSSITAEAGLMQTSWNVRSSSPTILQGLFNQYKAGAEGHMEIFREGVFCSANSWKNWGSGDGLQYQKMSKEQPMFHVEVTGVGLRNLRRHWGPINRRETEIRKEADTLLQQVEEIAAVVSV